MARGGRKHSRNYQWLPCVKNYLQSKYPNYMTYHEIIANAQILTNYSGAPMENNRLLQQSRMCPTNRSFTKALQGLSKDFERKQINITNTRTIPAWRLKRNESNNRTV